MSFYLTESEKILILSSATLLFLISVIVTVCIVSPVCTVHRWFFDKVKGSSSRSSGEKGSTTEQLLKPESKHFQLTVIPHYGTKEQLVNGHQLKVCPNNVQNPGNGVKGSKKLNGSFKSKAMTKKKGSLGPESPPFVSNVQPEPGNVRISFKLEQAEEDSSVKLLICLHEAHGLKSRDYGLEPASYLGLELFMMNGTRMSRRRTAHNKVLASFRTTSSKRTVNPMFDESFSTANISKAILKNGLLRIRLMDDERHANDVCIGELNLTIKDLVGCQDVHRKSYPLSSPKDFKADLLFGYCYLPTSQRVTITILKANLPSNVAAGVRNYYVRVLMFINGKMNKKKKTPTSEKLTWSDCETLTFELGPVANNLYHEQVTFMLVLSWSSDANVVSASSPSSPETPEAQDGTGSRKDRHIGCYVMGTVCWTEMMAEPRRQFTKWAKLL